MIKLKENPIEGNEISLGGYKLIVPPLNLKQIKMLKPEIILIDKEDDQDKKFDSIITIAHQALRRNYPEIERDEVEELLDMKTIPQVIASVMGQSGFDDDLGK